MTSPNDFDIYDLAVKGVQIVSSSMMLAAGREPTPYELVESLKGTLNGNDGEGLKGSLTEMGIDLNEFVTMVEEVANEMFGYQILR